MRCYIAPSADTNVAKQGCMCRDVQQQGSTNIKGLKLEDWAVPGICSLLSIGDSSSVHVATVDVTWRSRGWRLVLLGVYEREAARAGCTNLQDV